MEIACTYKEIFENAAEDLINDEQETPFKVTLSRFASNGEGSSRHQQGNSMWAEVCLPGDHQ